MTQKEYEKLLTNCVSVILPPNEFKLYDPAKDPSKIKRTPAIGEVWQSPDAIETRIITRKGSVSLQDGSIWGVSYPIDEWTFIGLASEILAVKV